MAANSLACYWVNVYVDLMFICVHIVYVQMYFVHACMLLYHYRIDYSLCCDHYNYPKDLLAEKMDVITRKKTSKADEAMARPSKACLKDYTQSLGPTCKLGLHDTLCYH